jgi:hypothetical protein
LNVPAHSVERTGRETIAAVRWWLLGGSATCLVLLVGATLAVAQSRQIIAGTYRGLMTRCLDAPQPPACRKDLTEIIRLADQVDAKQAEWLQDADGADRAQADRLYREYSLALDHLNRRIGEFNQEMYKASSNSN